MTIAVAEIAEKRAHRVNMNALASCHSSLTITCLELAVELCCQFVLTSSSELIAQVVNDPAEPLDFSVPLRQCLIETCPLAA